MQQLLNGFRTHACFEIILVLLQHVTVFRFGQYLLFHQRRVARVDYNIIREVQHPLQQTRAHIQDQPHPGRNPLKIPDMRHRRSQLNMPHTLTAHLGTGDLYAAFITNFALVTYLFIFAAVAFPVLLWPKDTLTEQAVLFRLERAVVDGFRLLDLPVGPFPDQFGRGEADLDCIERVITHPIHLSSLTQNLYCAPRHGIAQ